jgi:hypothetical protein
MDVTATSATDAFVIIKNNIRLYLEILAVTYSTAGQIGIKRSILTQPLFAMSEMKFAKALQSGDYLISGQVASFGNSVKTCMTGSNLKGFILSSADDELC